MSRNQFRVIVGSYEHNLLCLSLDLSLNTPAFTPIFHFQAHSLSVKCLDVSKRYLVSGSNDEHIRIYDLQKRKELGTLLAHQGSITALRFSKSETTIGDAEQDVDRPKTKKSGDKWLLSASEDNNIVIWRTKDWENFGLLKGHTARINDFDIHPSNRIAISVGNDHAIRLWNLMTVKKAGVLKLKNYNQNGQHVRWCGQSGEFFVVALLNRILLYKTSTAKVSRELNMGKLTIMHIEVEKLDDKEYLCIGLSDGSVCFFPMEPLYAEVQDDEPEFKPEFKLHGHGNRVKDFRFHKNSFGQYLVTIGSDGKVVVWDVKTKDQVAVYDCGERLNCVAICEESIEKYDSMRKRDSETAEIGEQSEAEEDPAALKEILLGKAGRKKKAKHSRKVEVQLE
ncbi:LAMI_0F03400g1_1 [Lachancea mirantina]|uniref:LAMI_0F03400g1_1 n=1 Tax=Lachancea mirantina TaxID=1230905 RepID=A0A1G4JX78_9SACH|nr:LAMI_0F03400g1_1 [Lachancea mirantina]